MDSMTQLGYAAQ